MRHRPVGLGVQGLADVFCRLKLPFESEAARQLNRDIFEAVYFGAVSQSIDLARAWAAPAPLIAPGANHFTLPEGLRDGELLAQAKALCGG